MQYFHSADFPARRRIAFWNDIYADRFAHVTFTPCREDFQAELRFGSLGSLGMADIRTGATSIERTSAHIRRSKSRIFSFLLLVSGSAKFSHYGYDEILGEGDFILCDSAAPHRIQFDDDSRLMLLRASPAAIKRTMSCPEQLCGIKLAANEGLTSTVSAMMLSIWQRLERGLDEHYHERLADHLMDMVSTAYSVGLGHRMSRSSVVGMGKVRARQYIEARLQDPDLNATAIAESMRISPRYLRMLFADDDENVSAYIMRRRLEGCRSEISEPGCQDRTITDIAFKWGFNSSAYFARAFRRRYGMTATEIRRLHTGLG